MTALSSRPSRFTWSDVARAFTPERLDALERALVPLVGTDEARLLHPWLCHRHAAAVVRVERLPWQSEPARSAHLASAVLVVAVAVTDEQGDIPWSRALVQLVASPTLASAFAQTWWEHMARAHVCDDGRCDSVFAVSAYAVAASEGLLQLRGERSADDVIGWLLAADRHMHFENGLDLVVVIRAARLLQPLLERAGAAPPR